MKKILDNFQELMNWRRTCPICCRDNVVELEFTAYKNIFENEAEDEISKLILINPEKLEPIKIEEFGIVLNLQENSIFFEEKWALNYFDININCKHDLFGKEYELVGEFMVYYGYEDAEFRGKSIIKNTSNKIGVFHEIFKVSTVYLEDEKPNGSLITIINDFNINKTSFSIIDVNLDGSHSVKKEKRIDLVDKDFFKFSEPKKVHARINSIFLLQ